MNRLGPFTLYDLQSVGDQESDRFALDLLDRSSSSPALRLFLVPFLLAGVSLLVEISARAPSPPYVQK